MRSLIVDGRPVLAVEWIHKYRGYSDRLNGRPRRSHVKEFVLIYDPRSWKEDTPDSEKYVTLPHGARYDLQKRTRLSADKPK